MDISICKCGGLAYKCALWGHLPGSIGHYHAAPAPMEVTVVWSGRDELIASRTERQDDRIYAMPTYDIDEGDVVETVKPKRAYNLSGKFKGLFSRTDPNAPHYKPTVRADDATEQSTNG